MSDQVDSDPLMRNLLVISYAFPPSAAIATHRMLAFVKYLEPAGWRSTVLSAENPVYPARDEELLAQIPASTRVIRTVDRDLLSVLQPFYQRIRGAPNLQQANAGASASETSLTPWQGWKRLVALHLRPPGWCPGWYRSTLRECRRLLRQERMDAIFSSGPPWSSHMVARKLAREFDLPWVADFRDQWVADPFDDPPTPPSVVKRDLREEARVVRSADVIVCVVDTLRRILRERYPQRRDDEIVTIMNGFDPAILSALAPDPTGSEAHNNRLQFLHTGHFYGKRRIEPFLGAIREWLVAEPDMKSVLQVTLVGGSSEYLARLRARIAAAGSPEYVEIVSETSHQEALNLQARATALLLVGFAGPGAETQMSGKIFEYLAMRRPIIALAPAASPVGEVLRASGVRHWIVSPDDAPGLVAALGEIARDWRDGKLAGPQGTASLSAFDRREQTKQLAAVLDQAISRRAPARGQ